jgi:hypothetical protein
MTNRAVLCASLAIAGVACEDLAHVSQFAIPEPVAPYQGLCNQCPADAGALAHAPCPSDNDEPTPGSAGKTYVYAWRSVSIGADATTLADPNYDVGLDEDCSTRPTGLPAWCLPVVVEPENIASPAWAPLPLGIDNSLAQRVIAPIVAFGGGGDIDGALSQTFEAGQYGELVVVQDWNGEPNDNDVTATFLGSPGTVSPPKWDGSDVWIPNAPLSSYTAFKSYVAGGVLVADTRSIIEDDSNISLESTDGQPLVFTLAGRFMVRVATITPTSMTMILSGRWNLDDALGQATTLTQFFASSFGLSLPDQRIIAQSLPALLAGAADLPLGEADTPGVQCGAISFDVKAQAVSAHIQGGP